jgi:hypothetical protein
MVRRTLNCQQDDLTHSYNFLRLDIRLAKAGELHGAARYLERVAVVTPNEDSGLSRPKARRYRDKIEDQFQPGL